MHRIERFRERPLEMLSVGLFTVLLFATAGTGCSNEPDEGSEGDACEFDADCKEGLLCRNDICVEGTGGDTGTDGGADAGDVGDAADTGGGQELEPEDYYISYLLEDRVGDSEGELRVYSTVDGEHTRVNPESVSCFSNCWLTRDLGHFVYTENAGGDTVDIMVAEVGDDLQAEGTGSPIAEKVKDVSVEGNYVTYVKPSSSNQTAFYQKVSGGEEQLIGNIDDSGDWFVDPAADVGVVYNVGGSAQSMNIQAGSATDRTGSGDGFDLGGPNFQRESGSYFGGNVMTAASRDGRLMAFATTGAPNDYDYCTPSSSWDSDKCDASKVYKCGNENRCVRLEATVHFIDTEATAELGEQCGGPNDCSDYHQCYTPSPSRQDEAMCIPGRSVLGVPETPQGPNRNTSGCQIVKEDDSIDYTGLNGPLTFDDDHNVYLVGTRDRSCLGNYETPNSEIVRVDAETRAYEAVEGLGPEETYEGNKCWDSEENDLDIEECQVYVDSARVSPGGDELAYSATNPLTQVGSRPRVITSNLFVWHIMKDGSQRWYTGDKDVSASNRVHSINVHPMD